MQAAVNFALYSSGASGVKLCLFKEADLQNGRLSYEVELDPTNNKTGDVWHIALPQLDANLSYGQLLFTSGFLQCLLSYSAPEQCVTISCRLQAARRA